MKCEHCSAEWTVRNSQSKITKCPFCGAELAQETEDRKEEVTMASVMAEIVARFGEKTVADTRRCLSLFQDLAPDLEYEQRLLRMGLQTFDLGAYFVSCEEHNREKNVRKAIRATEGMLAKEAQKTIITSFVVAFGWDKAIIADFFKEEPKDVKVMNDEKSKIQEDFKQSVKPAEVERIDADSLYQEGEKYYNSQNYIKAVECFFKAAEQGNANAQNNLGWMYDKGRGVTQDYVEAVKWYRKAAEQGHANAQNYLGVMYRDGRGVAQSDAEAAKWYRKAAEQGEMYAQNNLGVMYQNGRGVAQSDAEAAKWYRKAAEQGEMYAQNNLGWMYDKGLGVTQDYVEAVKWYRKAAEQGHADGQNNLGVMYLEGTGVDKNFDIAMVNFQKADAQGNMYAPWNLGRMYENGWGVQKNLDMAKQWYEKAAGRGHPNAKNKLEELKKSGCFITTAVCGSLNKPDDCDELMTMRWYRDKLKAEDEGMATLIREYYRVAPQIVNKIDNSKNAEMIYKELWENQVSKIFQNVKQKKYKEAELQYINMLVDLCGLYQVPLASGIGPIIKKVQSVKN